MKIIKSFGKRAGYIREIHVAFLVKALYEPTNFHKDIFVEASVDRKGIRTVSLRDNGTNDMLLIEHIDKDELHELIIKQTL